MVAKILAFFSALPKELYIFVVSLLPIVELRGAVPLGAALGVPFYLNYLLAVLGNMLPVPFILLFIPKFLTFLDRFKAFRPMVRWLRGKADKHSSKVLVEENDDGQEPGVSTERKMSAAVFVALMMFVALPIPTTGAWTGSLIASLFGLPFKKSLLAILLGVLICGVIMTLASYGVVGFLSFLT
jgi:uncharacterized membrane protein